MTDAIPPPPDLTRPFLRSQGLRSGLSLRTAEYRALFHGVYAHASLRVTPLLLAEAALLPFGPTAWASHVSAARVLGLPVPAVPEEHVTVLDRAGRRSREGIVCHSATTGLVQQLGGVRVSAPEQAFLELATMLPLVELVVVGDHLVRRGLVTVRRLHSFCAGARGPGAAGARRAVGFVRERVDSPMESRLRMLIVLAGLPEPEVNLLVGDGIDYRRYDLAYRRSRTVVEFDGRHHVERVEQWESDLRRREAIDSDAWRMLVVVARDVYADPERTLRRIHRALRERGEPGVPVRLSEEWRRHFPGRR